MSRKEWDENTELTKSQLDKIAQDIYLGVTEFADYNLSNSDAAKISKLIKESEDNDW
jgi:hypothetical protein